MARASEAPQRSFRYQPLSKENLRARANAKSGDFDSIIKPKYKVYKMRDGKNLVRILPPTWDNPEHYAFDLFINYSIGVDNQSYLSLSKMKGEKDPLAEAKREAERAGDKVLAKALNPRKRPAMWVIDRQDEDEGPQIMLCPMTLDTAIVNLSFDAEEGGTGEIINIIDPDTGCDVRFFKEGTGLKTDYDASKIRIMKPSPLHEDEGVINDWLEYIDQNPIPDCLQFYDYDHINFVFDGSAGWQERDEDADSEKPKRPVSARKPAEDPDDPPFDGGRKVTRKPVVEEDDETPLPARYTKPAAKPEPEEDEVAEPAPRQSIRERLAGRKRPAVEDDD